MIAGDGRQAADLVVHFQLPEQLAACRIEAVFDGILGAEEHAVAIEGGGRIDRAVGVVRPVQLARLGVKAAESAVLVADENPAVADGGRGHVARLARIFPALLPAGQIDGIERPIGGTNVNAALVDHRSGLKILVLGRESPQQFQSIGQRAAGHAASGGRAACERPCVGRRGVRRFGG